MELGEMALQQVLISKGALAMFVRTDEVAASKVSDVVVRRQSLLLLESQRCLALSVVQLWDVPI